MKIKNSKEGNNLFDNFNDHREHDTPRRKPLKKLMTCASHFTYILQNTLVGYALVDTLIIKWYKKTFFKEF
jgi:hypothetical protein